VQPFLVHATDSDPFVPAFLLYPVAIAAAWVVIRRNRDLRLPLG
jgi:hypothetical protein